MTSTGMICHVGPRGLVPYVRWVRDHIRPGGRYIHHCMMHHEKIRGTQPRAIGVAFNHDYVWPGFHWFSLTEHVEALHTNGFLIDKAVDLSPHYAKTTYYWYLRMM
jgi:cyclopropane-fatty-acyl-phospholipid synthase